ncbi:MAG: MMPL family transporter [Hyphomicrobiales bacterium]
MAAFPSPERLASFSTRRPWRVIAAWAVIVVLGITVAGGLGSRLSSKWPTLYEDIEAVHARDVIDQDIRPNAPKNEIVVISSQDHKVDSPEFRQFATGVIDQIRGLDGTVAGATSFYETHDPSLVSQRGDTLLVPVALAGDPDDAQDTVEPLVGLTERLDDTDGFLVATGGEASVNHTYAEISQEDVEMAEVIGLPIALIVLVVVFGALMAAGLPIFVGIAAIIAAFGITAAISQAWEMSIFVVNMITMIGLAVGIDYSLLIVQRFREERRRGLDRDAAIIRAGSTASRAVLFSGLTVIVALSGLLIVPDQIFRSVATGAIAVTVMAIAAAMTLLPAVLRLLDHRVDRFSIRRSARMDSTSEGGQFWTVVTGFVTRHAVISLVASASLLIAAAIPYFKIQLGSSGVASLPRDTGTYEAFTVLNSEFRAGMLSPTDIVITGTDINSPDTQAAIGRLRDRLASDPAFGPTTFEVAQDGRSAVLSTPISGDPNGDEAINTLSRLRDDYIPSAFGSTDAKVYVGGATATTQDYSDLVAKYTPWVFGFVLGLSFIVLLVVFRSIVVPIKAIIMNLLSVGAAYGLMVLVFQEGYGHKWFDFSQVDRIESWVPLFMFAVLFGLSMDYHVFLLTRIRERFDHTRNNAESVAYGVRTTAALITGAALIMVAVFSGFAAGRMVPMEQVGFGLAVSILLDATIVRIILVPAAMELLGDGNWYLPRWLEWLPRVDVEGNTVPVPDTPRRYPAPEGQFRPEGAPGQ